MTEKNACTELAELLFPHIADTPSGGDPDWFETRYPPRTLPQGAAVTRLGPSPTGFIHLGNLYTAFMNEKLSKETGGVCILRVEDTDRKREVEGAVEALISSLRYFGVGFDEGVVYEESGGGISEIGDYGPYYQSRRKEIYQAYARKLVLAGKAYPCFLTEQELNEIRARQEQDKQNPGVYGSWAKYRDIDAETCRRLMAEGRAYVVRLHADRVNEEVRSQGDEVAAGHDVPAQNHGAAPRYIEIEDGIRGRVSMPENTMDVVLLKSDGIPTYHFAHVVDDHLMGTTHVIRGEEWLSSLPIHVALFGALGFALPVYCHTTVLMKMEGETKRKLSKRKDPELSLEYYRREGYHPKAILEYLLTIINSNFEEWRAEHPDAPIDAFQMTTEKMSVSGILFDLEKLRDISKDVLARIPATALADFLLDWAKQTRADVYPLLAADPATLTKILDIGRGGDKPRKDLAYARQIFDFIRYFYDDFFTIEEDWPQNVPAEDIPLLLKDYLDGFAIDDDRDVWFGKIRELAAARGYAAKPKDYKKEPTRYKGHVGNVSAVIRIALVGRASSPDLYEIQQILGAERVASRIRAQLS